MEQEASPPSVESPEAVAVKLTDFAAVAAAAAAREEEVRQLADADAAREAVEKQAQIASVLLRMSPAPVHKTALKRLEHQALMERTPPTTSFKDAAKEAALLGSGDADLRQKRMARVQRRAATADKAAEQAQTAEARIKASKPKKLPAAIDAELGQKSYMTMLPDDGADLEPLLPHNSGLPPPRRLPPPPQFKSARKIKSPQRCRPLTPREVEKPTNCLERIEDILSKPVPMQTHFYLCKVDLLRIQVLKAPPVSSGYGGAKAQSHHGGFDNGMLKYEITGEPAALALLRRLAKSGHGVQGALSPLTTIGDDSFKSQTSSSGKSFKAPSQEELAKMKGVPPHATHVAFAYPLDCLEQDFNTLLTEFGSSAARVDDELIFFFLLGGFCYFDANEQFIWANALSPKNNEEEFVLDGPFVAFPEVADALEGRFRASHITPLAAAGIKEFAWVNPNERPDNLVLANLPGVRWNSGALAFITKDDRLIFWAVRTRRGSARMASKKEAVSVATLNEAFSSILSTFDAAVEESNALNADIQTGEMSGIEKWLRDFGWLLVLYYGFGILSYGYLEEFSAFDTCYFLTTTLTTVGYGDYCPGTAMGRLLTCFYAPIGVVVVMGGLVPVVENLLGAIDAWTARYVHYFDKQEKEKKLAQNAAVKGQDADAHEQEVVLRGLEDKTFIVGSKWAYIHATLAPLMMASVAIMLSVSVQGFTVINSAYWVIITFTTIGYGDLLPETVFEKLYTMALMLLATSAVSATISRFGTLSMAERIHTTNFRLKLLDMMRSEALKCNLADPTLTEDEFVLRTIIDFGLIDDKTVDELRGRFHSMCRYGLDEIDCRTVYDDLVRQGRVLDMNRLHPGIITQRKKLATLMAKERGMRNVGAKEETRGRATDLLFPAPSGPGDSSQTAEPQVDPVLVGIQSEITKLGENLSSRSDVYSGKEACIDMNVEDKGFNEWYQNIWMASLPVEPSAEGKQRSWLGLSEFGLRWELVGTEPPPKRKELINKALSQTLNSKTTFTRAEWHVFGISDLSPEHYVKAVEKTNAGDKFMFFQPMRFGTFTSATSSGTH